MFTMMVQYQLASIPILVIAAAVLLVVAPPAAVADRVILDGETMARLQADDAEYWHRILKGGKGDKGIVEDEGMEDEGPSPPLSGYCDKKDTACEYKNLSHEFIYREGLGELGLVPGINFLGSGYNIFEGNPRGTENSEVDPGFRYRAIKLRNDQNRNTAASVLFRLPYGVDTAAGFSCKFSSNSKEISNEQEYQTQLSTEAKQSTKSSVSGAGIIKGIPAQASTKFAFSKSEKFER